MDRPFHRVPNIIPPLPGYQPIYPTRPCIQVDVQLHNVTTTVAVGGYPCYDLCEQCHTDCEPEIQAAVYAAGETPEDAALAVRCVTTPFLSIGLMGWLDDELCSHCSSPPRFNSCSTGAEHLCGPYSLACNQMECTSSHIITNPCSQLPFTTAATRSLWIFLVTILTSTSPSVRVPVRAYAHLCMCIHLTVY